MPNRGAGPPRPRWPAFPFGWPAWCQLHGKPPMSLLSDFRDLGRLGWKERRALARAVVLLVVTRAALRLLPFRVVVRFVTRTPSSAHPAEEIPFPEDPSLHRMLWALDVMGRRLFPRNPCLTQAVAGQYLLWRRGLPSRLRIGVRRGDDLGLEAHAWLEHSGGIIMGRRGLRGDHVPLPDLVAPEDGPP
jgi:hypothetical protein